MTQRLGATQTPAHDAHCDLIFASFVNLTKEIVDAQDRSHVKIAVAYVTTVTCP